MGDWMYRTVAGLDTHEGDGAGYKHTLIKPQPGGGLTSAQGTLQTNYGPVSSGWKVENGKLILDVEVAPNTTATVIFPTENPETVTEKGKKVPLDAQRSAVLGSGKYVFEMPYVVADRAEKN